MGTIKHGDAKRGQFARLYRIWHNMKQRCYNPNYKDYKWYGAKGIQICEEWKEYSSFKEWAIANGYQDNLTIDRKDGDKNYCPENCRWIDMITQNNNKKSLIFYEYNGESHTISEWARILGVDRSLLKDRIIKLGWSIEKALTIPNTGVHPNLYTFNGETHTLKEWSQIVGIKAKTISSRLDAGWTIEKALTTPTQQKTKK